MAKPKIYFKKRETEVEGQLYLYYSYGGKRRFEYYTGLRVEEKYFNDAYWDWQNKKPIRKSFIYSDEYNNRLEEMMSYAVSLVIEDKVFEIAELRKQMSIRFKGQHEELDSVVDVDFVSYVERLLKERKEGIRTIVSGNRKGQKYKPNSLRNPGTTLTAIKSFLENRKIKALKFSDININFYNDFRKFIVTDNKNTVSTFATRVKDIKAFMNEAIEDGVTKSEGHKVKRFITPSYEGDSIALTLEEIKAIKNAELPVKMHLVRDLFLVACYSALRFSDLSELSIEDIDDKFIRAKQNKTGNRVTIPIMKELKSVLSKYGNGFPKTCSGPHFNRTIKEIVAHENVGIDKVVGHNDEGEPIMKSSFVTSHTGRRSYATNMFKLGIPNLLIMSATGHTQESVFLNYIKATNEDKANMLAEWMDKLDI